MGKALLRRTDTMHPYAPTAVLATAACPEDLAWQALQAVGAAVSIVDVVAPGSPLVFVNDAFCRLTGYAKREVLGRNCNLLQHADVDPSELERLRRGVRQREAVSVVLRNRRRDGTPFWNALELRPLVQADGQVTHYIGFQHDVSEWGPQAATLLSMDDCGQALSRHRFDEALAETLREQAAGARPHVVMVLQGATEPGSEPDAIALPQRVSMTARLREFVAPSGAICFVDCAAVALLAPVPDDETPGSLAGKVLSRLRPLWACHAGLAEPGMDGDDAATLISVARAASQRAAAAGAERAYFANPERAARDRRSRELMSDLALALPAGQLRAVYQPIVDLASGQMTGLEALLRWRHPTLGDVSPGEFIAQLERMPEIHAVTRWVLDTALGDLARWDPVFGHPLRMAVNVPTEALVDDGFVAFVRAALHRHGLSARQLEIELTERSLTRADGPAVERLAELRRCGVLVSMDDFGTAWSSLAYLARLPLDALKVDMQFTRGVTSRQADAAIARMTVELARGLGLHCVAEGIESPGQLRFFADLHCREGQGYLFSRPMEADAVGRFVAAPTPFPGFQHAPPSDPALCRHVLVVCEDAQLQQALSRTLRPTGWRIHSVATAEDAFEVLALHPVGVVLAGRQLPGMSGSEFLRLLKERHRPIRRILMAAHADVQALTDAINQGAVYKLLPVPWNDVEALATLETAFDEFELTAENARLSAALQGANRQLAQALETQGQRMRRGEKALDVMHAALSSVAVPVLGLQVDGALVFINDAAERLFGPGAALLGEPVVELLGLDPATAAGAQPTRVRLGTVDHDVHCAPMTTGTQTLGLIVTITESHS